MVLVFAMELLLCKHFGKLLLQLLALHFGNRVWQFLCLVYLMNCLSLYTLFIGETFWRYPGVLYA